MSINPIQIARERRSHARREATLDAVAYLRSVARDQVGTPGAAVRRSALGRAANEIDRGVDGAYAREIDRAFRAGFDAGHGAR